MGVIQDWITIHGRNPSLRSMYRVRGFVVCTGYACTALLDSTTGQDSAVCEGFRVQVSTTSDLLPHNPVQSTPAYACNTRGVRDRTTGQDYWTELLDRTTGQDY